MGIIGRDGRAFHQQGERAMDWVTGTQTPYANTSGGGPLSKFGSLEMMGADDDRAPPHRDATNLNYTPLMHKSFPKKVTL